MQEWVEARGWSQNVCPKYFSIWNRTGEGGDLQLQNTAELPARYIRIFCSRLLLVFWFSRPKAAMPLESHAVTCSLTCPLGSMQWPAVNPASVVPCSGLQSTDASVFLTGYISQRLLAMMVSHRSPLKNPDSKSLPHWRATGCLRSRERSRPVVLGATVLPLARVS